MADDILNMSLDDIIKQKQGSSKPAKERDSNQSRQRKGDRGGKRFEKNLKVTVPGKGTKGGSGGRRSEGKPKLPDVPRNLDALEGDAAWEHDLFEGSTSRARRIRPAKNGFKLLITNLDFKVTDDDILELFENCGPVKEAGVLYDRSGRSEEAAQVVFERREDALAAMKRYNNLALDNKPMKIELVEGGDAPGPGRTLASGIRLGNSQRERPARPQRDNRSGRLASNRSKPGSNRQPRGRGSTANQQDLDKELDTYMATD